MCGSPNLKALLGVGHANTATIWKETMPSLMFSVKRHFIAAVLLIVTLHMLSIDWSVNVAASMLAAHKRKLKERLAEHKYAIRTQNPNYPTAQHYKTAGHTSPDTLKCMAIEVVPSSLRGGDFLDLHIEGHCSSWSQWRDRLFSLLVILLVIIVFCYRY